MIDGEDLVAGIDYLGAIEEHEERDYRNIFE